MPVKPFTKFPSSSRFYERRGARGADGRVPEQQGAEKNISSAILGVVGDKWADSVRRDAGPLRDGDDRESPVDNEEDFLSSEDS
jgi:hypothetical protein